MRNLLGFLVAFLVGCPSTNNPPPKPPPVVDAADGATVVTVIPTDGGSVYEWTCHILSTAGCSEGDGTSCPVLLQYVDTNMSHINFACLSRAITADDVRACHQTCTPGDGGP